MPKKTKKFIDKKSSVTFQLVHRSQQDPLIADESAPQRVLLPATDNNSKDDVKKRIEEQHKYGIYYDDDYNYLQHLRDTSRKMEWEKVERIPAATNLNENVPKLSLPSSVFASEVEEDVGLLNKAAPVTGPQLHLDPDIIAAMDDDFDYDDPENQLDDNFMELANAEGSGDEYDEYEESDVDSTYSDEERDEVGSLKDSQLSFNKEETKSRFTNYSMSSSVIRRNEQLTLLDDRFEKMYASYDENEIGALDCDEIEGHVPETSDILLQYADEFEKSKKREQLDKEAITNRLELDSSSESEEMETIEVPEKEKWDCQSILSTYSNTYNHPKLITEPKKPRIKINKKTGMPVDVLGSTKLTAKALSQLNEANGYVESGGPKSIGGKSVISQLSALSIRPKDESPEQRKERKKLLKEYRKERRLEKKANTQAFKEEAKRQVKITINNRNNVQGNKIL